MVHPARKSGWDIRLQCTVCGFRSRANRYEGNVPFGHEPPATVIRACSNCNADEDYPDPEIETVHFVDIATDEELKDKRYAGYNRKPGHLPEARQDR